MSYLQSGLVRGITGLGVALAVSSAFAAADFRLERLTPREMYVAPGQATTYTLRIRNIGDAEGTAHVGDDTHDGYAAFDDFTSYHLIQSSRTGCGEPGTEYTDFFNDYRIIFDAGPIAPNAYLDCTMTILRDATSRHDMAMSWGVRIGTDDPPFYDHYVDEAIFGTLTDVSLETHTFGFYVDESGFAHATAVLNIHNGGSLPIDPENVGACEDNFVRPFFTDGSGDGGCGDDEYHPVCFDWGYGFRTPEIEAGGTYRCLIRLTSVEPYIAPLGFPIRLDDLQYGGGFSFIDVNRDNDDAVLRLEPDAADDMAVPSSSRFGLIVCGLVFLALAVWGLSRVQRF